MNDKEKAAVKELKNYNGYLVRVKNLEAKIKALDEISQPGISYDGIKVDSGFKNTVENSQITRIEKKEELERALTLTKVNIDIIERALKALAEDEYIVLDRFYINRQYRAADKLTQELQVNRTTVYQLKEAALRKFIVMTDANA